MSYTYGPIDPLATEPRYTTVAIVEKAVGIDSDNYTDAVKLAIVSAEYVIDVTLGHSFPDPAPAVDDTGIAPPIEGIPEAVSQAAQLGATRILAANDVPGTTAGADDFLGTFDFENETRRALAAMSPLLIGLKRRWGLA